MSINISFGGASIKRPGSYSTVDTSNMIPISLGAFNVLAAIGVASPSSTVSPGTVVYFNSPADAKAALGSNALLDHMNIAWAHGADLIGVSVVAVDDEVTPVVPTDVQWQAAIDLLEKEFIDGIILATDTAAIQTKVQTHITAMSTTKSRRERRAFYGHTTGLATSAVVALQTAINTEYAMLATPGVYYPDATGAQVLQSSTYLAAAYAGMWAGQNPEEPLTYKYVRFSNIEKIYSDTDIETLLESGIAPVEVVRGKGYRIVQGVTCSTSEDLTQNELSVSTLKVTMSRNLRDFFEEKYIGKAGVANIEISMYADAIAMIEGFLKLGWISSYIKESVRITKYGTQFSLDWEGSPTLPINNFLITSHFTL